MNKELLEKILTVAVQAPSGDNSQPWRFQYHEPILTIHTESQKDHRILNVHNGGTLIALGALLYNLRVAASYYGYETIIGSISNTEDTQLTVTFQTTNTRSTEPNLRACVDRHTNRRPYLPDPIPEEVIDAMFAQHITSTTTPHCTYVTSSDDRQTLAAIASLTEEISLETKELHELFFTSIFWDRAANDAGRPGLYIDTLELPPPARIIFKVLRYWRVASLLNRVHFARKASAENRAVYASGPLIGAILPTKDTTRLFIETGTIFEHIWTEATRHGLGLQPLAGTLFLIRYVEAYPQQKTISLAHTTKLKAAAHTLRAMFKTDALPSMMFRIGYTQPATAVSGRKKPSIEYTKGE